MKYSCLARVFLGKRRRKKNNFKNQGSSSGIKPEELLWFYLSILFYSNKKSFFCTIFQKQEIFSSPFSNESTFLKEKAGIQSPLFSCFFFKFCKWFTTFSFFGWKKMYKSKMSKQKKIFMKQKTEKRKKISSIWTKFFLKEPLWKIIFCKKFFKKLFICLFCASPIYIFCLFSIFF